MIQILRKSTALVLLIFIVIIFLLGNSMAMAHRDSNLTKEDKQWAKDLAVSSKLLGLEAIKDKWVEFQKLQQQFNSSADEIDSSNTADQRDLDGGAVLKVFVSKSMGTNLLKTYIKQAKKYNAALVFNGLPNGSWLDLSYLIQEIADDKEIAIQIDDEAFKIYNIVSVPSFVLIKEPDQFAFLDNNKTVPEYDKVSGNIGIRRALETIIEEGVLVEEANSIIEGDAW